MNAQDCGLGYLTPKFQQASDIDQIREAFYEDGVTFVDDCDEDTLVKLGESFGTVAKPRNEVTGGKGVSNIRCAPGLEGKGYSNQELFFHTDRSGWDVPPQILATSMKVRSETGGESILVDGQRVLESMRQQEPLLYDLVTSSKYSSFRADDGTFKPRPIYDEQTGILRFRFDDGIQLAASLVDNFKKLTELVYKNAFVVRLEPGQCYIADNHRVLHGRCRFTGARELLRVLADPHPVVCPKFVLFDVDGTLCRAEALSIDAYYRCLSDITGCSITNENTKVNLHGQTDLSLLRCILTHHGYGRDDIEVYVPRFLQAHSEYLQQSLATGLPSVACPQVTETLTWLALQYDRSSRKVSVGLLTGNSQQNALLKIKAADIPTECFNLEISSFGNEHTTRASLVQHSIRKIRSKYRVPVQASDIILIGDTPLDIRCAKDTGCRVVAVATGNYDRDCLAAYAPDVLCKALPEAWVRISQILSY